MFELVFDDSYKHRLVRLYTAFAPSIRSKRQWGGVLVIYELAD